VNFRITFIVLTAIIVASVIFSFSMDLYIQAYDSSWRGLLNGNENDEKKKIFIIGSSSVYSINATHINQNLVKDEKNYVIYDLADMSDVPSKRLKSIENILVNKPKIVVYGLGIWEFKKVLDDKLTFEQSLNYILRPHDYFEYLFDELIEHDFQQQFPTSPRDRTLTLLKYIIRGPDYVYHPFIHYKNTPINDYETILKKYGKPKFEGIDVSENSKEVIALKNIITIFKKNNIQVIIFTNPYHKITIDSIDDSDIEEFTSMLQDISKEYDVDVFFLHDKYVDLNIWRDPFHVAIDPDASIFTNDIQEIIFKELIVNAI